MMRCQSVRGCHADDLVAGIDGGRIELRSLLDLLDGVDGLCGIVDDAAAELRVRRGREQKGKSADR